MAFGPCADTKLFSQQTKHRKLQPSNQETRKYGHKSLVSSTLTKDTIWPSSDLADGSFGELGWPRTAFLLFLLVVP